MAKKKIVKKAKAKKAKKPARRAVKKAAPKKKKVLKRKAAKQPKAQKPVGAVTHFYNEISVAIVKFNTKVPVGTILHFRGATTDFMQEVASMQFDHEPIAAAPKGKLIGIKVKKRVRQGDAVHVHKS